ncbi:P-loop containing nucleoside triphosphate hydrolase protein [Hygrophoropsis aurantiaca]|uniref:P-loop containing nucleoside triphosphate hydrolase protein n=1 Tax=Hygrophoropsis aurantiaca TaxID=72124 RepID=A0ACB8AS35_9AGAM|nr:P-loop containing nucleoside triphosphate hydrolase protein [Hygrophoropsis aurantiaca]
MSFHSISLVHQLTGHQKAALAKGGFSDLSQLLLATTSDISRNCHLSPQEVHKIVEIVCKQYTKPLISISEIHNQGSESFTTGDVELDIVIGGGIKTGMIWEIVGESAAGKTQVALQLCLAVQLPFSLGGIGGSACYLTIASKLPTTRMEQLLNTHPLFSPSVCSMADVQTLSTPTIDRLIFVLSNMLPNLISNRAQDKSVKPVKLIIIDAVAELFHSLGRTTTKTLVERSRQLSEISTLLHSLASQHQIAILVLNEVIDVVDRGSDDNMEDMSYRDQSRWFSRGDSIPGEDRKEATLGLVWANQVNARIFLTRTGRRRYLEESAHGRSKKSHDHTVSSGSGVAQMEAQPDLIRRLNVIFSSVSAPVSCDYIVTAAGVSVVPDTIIPLFVNERGLAWKTPQQVIPAIASERSSNEHPLQPQPEHSQVSPLDIGCLEDNHSEDERPHTPPHESGDDEWDSFWAQNDLPNDAYTQSDVLSSNSTV